MKKTPILLALIIILIFGFSACKKDNEDKKAKKIVLIGGVGGFDDQGYNQSALAGFNRALSDFNFEAETLDSHTAEDFTNNIQYCADQGFDLVITLGFEFAEPVKAAATAHPGMHFLIIDYQYPSIPPNVICANYSVDESSFPAGVLAAYWADKTDPASPQAGFVGGPDTAVSGQFSRGYINGMNYFNALYNKHVHYSGTFANSYSDSLEGADLAESLITYLSADVIFAFAGKTGNAALIKAKEYNIRGIGVDVDQYYTLPSVSDMLLTSCLKKVDNTVYEVISKFMNGEFAGGSTLVNNLGNNGVGLAPYHDYETQLPEDIKSLITQVMADIKSGALSTGVK